MVETNFRMMIFNFISYIFDLGREIVAKYLRLERYHEHFPEARESGSTK